MFRLDNILEQWAAVYKPLSHPLSADTKPQDKAFFRIDTLDIESEWSRNQNLMRHPCMLYCANVDAELDRQNPRHISRVYRMYLTVPQLSVNNAANDLDAADCRYLLDDMAIDLLAFLFDLQSACNGKSWRRDTPAALRAIGDGLIPEEREYVRGLRLEETAWFTAHGRTYSRWWFLGIEMEGLDPRRLCILPAKYNEEEDDEPQP